MKGGGSSEDNRLLLVPVRVLSGEGERSSSIVRSTTSIGGGACRDEEASPVAVRRVELAHSGSDCLCVDGMLAPTPSCIPGRSAVFLGLLLSETKIGAADTTVERDLFGGDRVGAARGTLSSLACVCG